MRRKKDLVTLSQRRLMLEPEGSKPERDLIVLQQHCRIQPHVSRLFGGPLEWQRFKTGRVMFTGRSITALLATISSWESDLRKVLHHLRGSTSLEQKNN